MRKLTYEYVEERINEMGYELVSKTYKDSSTKLKISCPEHGIFNMKYGHISSGSGCPVCGGTKKLTIEYVRGIVEERGFELFSKRYVGAHGKLKIRCGIHGIFKMSYANFSLQNSGCPECSLDRVRLTYGNVKKEIERRNGYTFVSKKYKNAHEKLRIHCHKHGIFEMTYSNFFQGQGCPSCAGRGFNPDKPASLYYLEVLHRGRYYYKIGITNYSVQKRYSNSDLERITILGEWDYEYGRDCRDEEQRIIDNFKDYLYKGRATVLEGAVGNAELFTENVLQL